MVNTVYFFGGAVGSAVNINFENLSSNPTAGLVLFVLTGFPAHALHVDSKSP